MAVAGGELPRQRHEAKHQLLPGGEIAVAVIAQEQTFLVVFRCSGDSGAGGSQPRRRLPRERHLLDLEIPPNRPVPIITLLAEVETRAMQLKPFASSTISRRSSSLVIVNTRCTGSGPRTMTMRRPASRARSSAVTMQRRPVESRKVSFERSTTTVGGCGCLHPAQLLLDLADR